MRRIERPFRQAGGKPLAASLLPLLAACVPGSNDQPPCGFRDAVPVQPATIDRGVTTRLALEFPFRAFAQAGAARSLSFGVRSPEQTIWLFWRDTDTAFLRDVRYESDRRLAATVLVPDWMTPGRWFLEVEQFYEAGCDSLLVWPQLEVR